MVELRGDHPLAGGVNIPIFALEPDTAQLLSKIRGHLKLRGEDKLVLPHVRHSPDIAIALDVLCIAGA
jgi:hypothetical protein